MPAGVPSYTDVASSFDPTVLSRSETVLLVEDEAFVREVAVEVLRSAGYAPLTAKNGAEAHRLYDRFSNNVGLLLTDVVLPDVNGRELARTLRDENPQLPVLLVTGYPEQIEMIKAEGLAMEWLAKPFSTRALLEKVRAVLQGKRWKAGWSLIMPACGIE